MPLDLTDLPPQPRLLRGAVIQFKSLNQYAVRKDYRKHSMAFPVGAPFTATTQRALREDLRDKSSSNQSTEAWCALNNYF